MSRRAIGAIAAIGIAVCGVFGQAVSTNARVDALGGTIFPLEDVNDILINPAWVNEYQGVIQGTFVGPVFGIAGVGDIISIGTHINTGDVSVSNFYNDAVIGNPFANVTQGSFPAIPHFLFGLNLDVVQIGLDAYFLGRGYKQSVETNGTTAETSAFISHFGAIAGALFDLDAFQLGVRAGLGFPRRKGDVATPETEYTTESSLFLPLGVDATIDLGNAALDVGALYQLTNYQFASQPQGGQETKGNVNNYHAITPYFGGSIEVFDNTVLTAQYAPILTVDISESDDETQKNTTFARNHQFGAGLEKSTGLIWIFDDLIARAGITYAFNDTTTTVETSVAGAETKTVTSQPLSSAGANPSVGLGLTKGKFTLDTHLNLGQWLGFVAGPSVFKATATVNFGEQASGFGASTPSYTPAPSYEAPAEEAEEPGPTDDFSF